MTRRKPRSYTYRVPVDDRRAIRKIHALDRLNSGYFITELHSRDVPNGKAVQHWGYVFYESKEHRDFETDEIVGGTIPGLHKYRYSLDWEPTPETELLEMRNANGGGTRIKGEHYVGTSDPRLPDYAPIDTTVPWTPTEIKSMYDGEPVENKTEYSWLEELPGGRYVTRRPDTLQGDRARAAFMEQIELAAQDGIDECERLLEEKVNNCEHNHVVETGSNYVAAYCEDCGREWDDHDFAIEMETGDLTVVGTV